MLSPVSLRDDTADVHNDDNLGVALEATVQVSLVKTCLSLQMYNVCKSICVKGRGPWTTSFWPINGKFHWKRHRTWYNVQAMGHSYCHVSHSVKVFLN